jgi:hypothetical protein
MLARQLWDIAHRADYYDSTVPLSGYVRVDDGVTIYYELHGLAPGQCVSLQCDPPCSPLPLNAHTHTQAGGLPSATLPHVLQHTALLHPAAPGGADS